jgi:bacteriocin-like protein
MKDTAKDTVKEINKSDLEQITGGSLPIPGIPGIPYVTAPADTDKDEPKDGGATYTW